MDCMGKMRTQNGEPLLCFIMNLSKVHYDVIDALLGIGLPMYEAINWDLFRSATDYDSVRYNFGEPMPKIATPLDLTFLRDNS